MPVNLTGMTIARLACLALFALIVSLGITAPPLAQAVPDPHEDPHEGLVKPPDQLPKLPPGERNRNIDFLFGALKVAPDESSAKSIEDRIWAVWTAPATKPPTC